jgi:hypothetical protein
MDCSVNVSEGMLVDGVHVFSVVPDFVFHQLIKPVTKREALEPLSVVGLSISACSFFCVTILKLWF